MHFVVSILDVVILPEDVEVVLAIFVVVFGGYDVDKSMDKMMLNIGLPHNS